jgi:hypothetical protein
MRHLPLSLLLLLCACEPDTSYVDQMQADLQAQLDQVEADMQSQIDQLSSDLEAANAQIAAQNAVYCWDLDGSGQCELAGEDLDGDGACTALDCRGPAGDPGAEGAQGPAGAAGADGANCFDVVGDVNGDGTPDAEDCLGADGPQGPPGDPGSAGLDGANCYDLVGDVDGDGTPDADDCLGAAGPQGPPGTPGSAGLDGANCYDLVGDFNGDQTVDVLDCTGPEGPAGSAGASGLDGANCYDFVGDANSDGVADVMDCSEDSLITSDLTILVPSQAPDIAAALAQVAPRRIANGATVTVQVAPGAYAIAGDLLVDHPDGASIRILGASSASTVLSVTGGELLIETGLGLLGDLTLDGDPLASGVHLLPGSRLTGIQDLVVENAFYGFQAEYGSAADITDIVVRDPVAAGIYVGEGAAVVAMSADVESSTCFLEGYVSYGVLIAAGSTSTSSGAGCTGYGYVVSRGGYLDASGGTATGNGQGFSAQLGGVMDAQSATAETSSSYGFHAQSHATLYASDAVADSNNIGYLAEEGGYVNAVIAHATLNTADGFGAERGGYLDAGGAVASTNGSAAFYVNGYSLMFADGTTGTGVSGYIHDGPGHIERDGSSGFTATFEQFRPMNDALDQAVAYCALQSDPNSNGSMDTRPILDGETGAEACGADALAGCILLYDYGGTGETSLPGVLGDCLTYEADYSNPYATGAFACCSR